MPIRAVFFDWDNTLADSFGLIHAAFNETLAFMGHDIWDYETARHNIKRSARESFPELFGDRWKEANQKFYSFVEHQHLDHVRPFDDAPELLTYLKDSDIAMGIVSNKRSDLLRAEVRYFGWDSYFGKAVIGAGDAKADKPDPEPVFLAMKMAGYNDDPMNALYVGDTDMDIVCGHRAGCKTVYIEKSQQKFTEAIIPDVTVSTLSELKNYIAQS